ncbi:RNA-processing protein [Macleaya cordata]|uniref:RNA-processing protein n=1 Tax=Macleaya cordata TaxID=56857 RepID=A0A200PYG9_MACCD|nr:RNA-processing protein [Macleaya cordata]
MSEVGEGSNQSVAGSSSKQPKKVEEKKARDVLLVDKYNVEASEILANEALLLPISEAVPIYEQLLSTFPTAAKYWKQYLEAHMAVNNDDATKQIFSRCLLNCLQIPLWRCYIRFIRKVNDKKGAEGQEETRKAFDFMLNYVGTDIASGPVWMEYITFLKSLPAMTGQEESQRMTSIRKAYQKAIITPTHHVEQLWKDYENFENSVSRALAKGLISEYQPKYNSARAVYRERKKYVDEIDWNMLAVPPSGSYKEEQQCMAWKRFLAFEKGNPQRIDSGSSNRRIAFTYEQCLMYLYHYPDIWYDYATWHAKTGLVDSAIKVFQRALKALPDSEVLRYAYAELEESRGAIQPAKKIYESLLGDGVNASALAHIQFIRFLRRTQGVEAARKYFLDARKSPNCTYHVYVAYAMMAFCLDKDPKVAHNVFEAGLKRFMHEPGYILEYADFLCRLNDDRNIRALFERALSSLPPEESVEVWKRFTQFEQTYGDLASMLKVEQRRKEALSRTGEEGTSALEGSLHDVVSRYSFMDLWPCSSKDLDYLARQEWLVKNINKKVDKSILPNGASSIVAEKGSSGLPNNSKTLMSSAKVIYPDTSRMIIYDPRQKQGAGLVPNTTGPGLPAVSSPVISAPSVAVVGGTTKGVDEILKVLPPALVAFITHLPTVEGPSPDVDIVLSILLQSNVPTGQTGKLATPQQQLPAAPAPSTSDLSGSNKSRPNPSGSSFRPAREVQSGKRKDIDRQEDDETSVQSRPLPRDVFRLRQMQKARGVTTSQTGSAASGGSAFSGELSGSTE